MINETMLKQYCSEDISKIENYEQAINDKTQTWDCHHRLEIQGQFRNSPSLLKKCGLYYNVPAWQLIFLTKADHTRLHKLGEKHNMFGKHHSEETKKKMSMSLSGKSPWNKGKHLSEETRKKMSISHSGEKSYWFGKHLSEETRKKMSEKALGKHHSEESRKKMSAMRIGMKYWNNGTINKRSKECPGEGWVRGRLKRNNHK